MTRLFGAIMSAILLFSSHPAMAVLSVSALRNTDSEASLSITCDPSATITVRQRVRLIGSGDTAAPKAGDLVLPPPDTFWSIIRDYCGHIPPIPWNINQPVDPYQVGTVQRQGDDPRFPGLTTASFRQLYQIYQNGDVLDQVDSVWRGTDGQPPVLKSAWEYNSTYWGAPNGMVVQPDGTYLVPPFLFDTSFNLSATSTVILYQWGKADSWGPGSFIEFSKPKGGVGLKPIAGLKKSVVEGPRTGVSGDSSMGFGWGWWHTEQGPGHVGNSQSVLENWDSADDGHMTLGLSVMTLAPKTYSTGGSGTARTATADDIETGSVLVVESSSGERAELTVGASSVDTIYFAAPPTGPPHHLRPGGVQKMKPGGPMKMRRG